MKMPSVSLERAFRIWDDDSGDYIQISDDDDGLDMMKISTVANLGMGKEEVHTIYINPDYFDLFAKAVTEYTIRKSIKPSDYRDEVFD